MRIVSYNIMNGGEGRADPIAEVILAQRPDIVAIVEADHLAVLERLAMRLKMDFVQAQRTSHACALLSHWTIRESINHAALDGVPLLEAIVMAPDGAEWSVGVGSGALAGMTRTVQLLAGELDAQSLAKRGYVDTLTTSGGTFSTQDPAERRDFILTHGIDRSRIKSGWIETDRLAKYASDHFPIGAEIV